ncbi:MAG: N-acetylmuramic acid 6-phosphate etherase [Anaerolineaceae bacterium]|nr:N-acetylmuramic acid 6-phosphate etherase [Anaerolineaceae bacterium]
MITEQPNPSSEQIDMLSPLEIVQIINREDQMVAKAVEAALPQIAQAVEAITSRIEQGGRLIYIGAGTSGRLAVLDAAECVPTYSVPPDLVQAIMAGGERALVHSVEGAEDDRALARRNLEALPLTSRDTLVGIAASGTTPYVLEAVTYARELGAVTVGIACNIPAPLLDAVDIPIGVVSGPEVIAGSTRMKAGTAQKLILNMLSTATMIRLGKVYGNLMVDVSVSNDKLLRRAQGLVAKITGVEADRAAELLNQARNEVKTAIVMERKQVDPAKARELLAQANGHLRRVIG